MAAIAALTLATIVHSPAASTARVSVGDAKPTSRPPAPATPAPTTPVPSTAAPTTPPATTTPPPPSLPKIIDALAGSHTGSLSVAVAELDGSRSDAYARGDNDDGTFDTASIVKVDILAALLLRAQREGTSLSGRERDLATDMIEASDNDAALALWEDIGGAAGLHTANKKLGLRHTTGGPGDLWGLTQTTAPDQIALLRAVFTTHSALTAASRSYLTGLMKSVESGQRWGVSAADSDGSGYAIKNGWLQRSATGLWDINSIGEVRYQGHTLLISVLSEGQYSEQGAIDLVQRVALAAAKTLVAEPAK
ncbi:serine hydrolase [Streptomyces sp. CA-111067]|uniref:serine hydrolase n=1 Tax=Streptomyces sp. CA-111067 TaxID=3240046 RepID=UPI003D979984